MSCTRCKTWIRSGLHFAVLLGIWIYFGFVVYLNGYRAVFVGILTVFTTFYVVNHLTNSKLVRLARKTEKRLAKRCRPRPLLALWIRRASTITVITGIVVFLVLDIWDTWHKWIPLSGLAVMVGVSVMASKKPSKINWTTVVWGIILQFTLGLVILRWKRGFRACQWLGLQVTTLLSYTDIGSEFVFGEKYTDHPIVFKILPTVIFFSSLVSMLYYLGAMQAVIKSIAIVLRFFMNTTPIESFSTAALIFIGQVETSVALKPFWYKLTDSEIHAVVTSGFATVSGSIIGAYVEFGVPAEHVISASFMSAPAALAIAKISYPETEISQIKTLRAVKLPSGQETNLIEALSVGATIAVKLVSFVVVNIIAFIAVFGFLDAILSYFGTLVGFPELSFQIICSYIFMPIAAMIGIPWSETGVVGALIGKKIFLKELLRTLCIICSYIFMPVAAMIGIPWSETGVVGALIGKKIFLNELLSYADLGVMLQDGQISNRSAVLSTYILCGFGSIAALGVNIGSLSSAAPDIKSTIARLVLRAMINGNIACFMTACVAGLLYQDESTDIADGMRMFNESQIDFNLTTAMSNLSTILYN